MTDNNGEHGTVRVPLLSIVVPVYRSAATVRELFARIARTCAEAEFAFEVVFVNDASPDGVWPVLVELQRAHPNRVVVIELMRNFGQHNALMCGFRHARGQFILTMDDDLQNPPEEIPKLVRAIREGNFDLVYGVPELKQHAVGRNLGSAAVNWFYRQVFRMPVTVTSLRIMRRELVNAILTYNLNFTFIDGLLAWNTQRVGQVTVEHHARENGRSGYSIAKLVTLALNLFTNFSLLPLQIATGVGLAASVLGLGAGAYYLLLALTSSIAVPGYASTIVAVLVLGGLQLLALGIIGEYIGRLHLNVNRKPQYTVRQVLGRETAHGSTSDGTIGAAELHPGADGEASRESAAQA